MKERWSDKFFSLTRGERYVATFFICTTTLILSISAIKRVNNSPPELNTSEIVTVQDSLEESLVKPHPEGKQAKYSVKNNKLNQSKTQLPTVFCPDTLTLSEWEYYGLSERQAQSILKYKATLPLGFDSISLGKAYALPKDFLSKNAALIEYCKATSNTLRNELTIDLNKATAKELTQIKGIGKVFAERIIAYRKLLGGFYSKEQLNEVYGLNVNSLNLDVVSFISDRNDIERLDLNKCSLQELSNHPYVSYKMAKIILNFTSQRSDTGTLNDLYSIEAFNDDELERIIVYLNWND